MQLSIRRYHPSDKDSVLSLYILGIQEHTYPCFRNAVTSPDYLTITLALCGAGYLLGSALGAVVLPAVWIGFLYYCCSERYARNVRLKLRTDMQDIPGCYLSRPDNCFWVAVAEVDGRAQVIGTVAVMAKQSKEETNGEIFRMIVSPHYRGTGLGTRLAQTAIDFSKERGFSKMVLHTSTIQTSAIALYKKLGFYHVLTHTKTVAPDWMVKMSKSLVFKMEKPL